MSLILIGPWLHALWIRASEAGHCETVNAHPDRAERVVERVAHSTPDSQFTMSATAPTTTEPEHVTGLAKPFQAAGQGKN